MIELVNLKEAKVMSLSSGLSLNIFDNKEVSRLVVSIEVNGYSKTIILNEENGFTEILTLIKEKINDDVE